MAGDTVERVLIKSVLSTFRFFVLCWEWELWPRNGLKENVRSRC